MKKRDKLFDDVFRYRRAVLLLSAGQTGLWDYLITKDAINLSGVVRRFNWSPRAAGIFLNALCSLGYIEKTGDTYRMAAGYREIFTPADYRYLKEWLHHEWRLLNRWLHLPEVLQTGQPFREPEKTALHRNHRNFILSMAHREKINLDSLLKEVDWGNASHLLDLGGGPGLFSIGFVEKYPKLRATVFDTPETEALAREFFRSSPGKKRLQFKGGNFLTDNLGQGYDAVMISSVLHIYSPEQNQELLRKVFRAMGPQGKIVIRDFLLNSNKTGPLMGSLFAVNMLVNTEGGNAYSASEIRSWLKKSGFRNMHRNRLEGRMVLLQAEKLSD